jgi:histidinol phosphatase-like PHP family hydrolase
LKLDLHTHVFEEFLPGYPGAITQRSVEKLVAHIKHVGLDGIAITEHDTKAYGYRVKEIVETKFNNEVLIIPGQEFQDGPIHFVELDLPCNGIVPFKFVVHPGYPGKPNKHIHGFNGIEISNALHNWHIDQEEVIKMASEHHLVLLSNSDAHYLRDVGRCFTEISLEDLCRNCQSPPSSS